MSNVTTGSSGSKIDTFTRDEGGETVHMQAVVPVDPESGSPVDSTNWILRTLSRVFGRFSFNSSSALRVDVASGSTNVVTMTTGYVALGDSTKAATLIMMSRSAASNQYSRLTQV